MSKLGVTVTAAAVQSIADIEHNPHGLREGTKRWLLIVGAVPARCYQSRLA